MCVCGVFVCILILVIRLAQRLRRIILSFAVCLILQYFSTYLTNDSIVGEEFTEHNIVFYTHLSETFIL